MNEAVRTEPDPPTEPLSRPAAAHAAILVSWPSLVWGFDFSRGRREPVPERTVAESGQAAGDGEHGGPPIEGRGSFRWPHVNITDQSSCRWIEGLGALPDAVRDLLLSPDTHQRALVADGFVACVLHDFEVDFARDATSRVGALRIALGAGGIVTARHHPLYAADVVKRRLDAGFCPETPEAAFELVVASIAGVAAKSAVELGAVVQASEDALLEDGWAPDQRALVKVRRRAVQIHRQLSGMRSVLQRLEEDEDLPAALLPTIEKLSQRLASLDGDVVGIQTDLRLLRDELDLQASHRTNRNLYVLSILSALLLPATLVTGFFGMNTGGFPWDDSPYGTLLAGLAAAGSAFAVYVWLRRQGFLGGE